MIVGELLGPVPDRRGEQQLPAGRRPQTVLGPQAALVGDPELADLLHLVAEELDPERVFLGGREHVHDAAADGQFATALHHVGPRIADVDQAGDQVTQVGGLAGPQ